MIKTDAKNRSKRLRKKLFVEEFKVLGFEVDMSFVDSISDDNMNVFFEDFLANAVESNELVFGGGGSKEGFSGFIVPSARYASATEENRKAISDWLGKNEFITEHSLSDLMDANFVL